MKENNGRGICERHSSKLKGIGNDVKVTSMKNGTITQNPTCSKSKSTSKSELKKDSKKKKRIKKCESDSSSSKNSGNTLEEVEPEPNWNTFLSLPYNVSSVAPVSFFKCAPLTQVWDEYSFCAIGKSVELPNIFVDAGDTKVNWVATVKAFAGYKALVEYVTFGINPKRCAWVSFCSSLPKPLGYSTRNRILLYPPLDVAEAFPNYMEKLGTELKSTATIKEEHGLYVRRKIQENQRKYPLKSKVEALDRTYISRVRIATVTGIIGDRVHITYDVEPIPNDEGFVFSVHSDAIHPIGWAKEVGQEIFDPVEPSNLLPLDALPSYPTDIIFNKGQILEARHPLDPYIISEASIDSVLKHGYLIISFKSTTEELRRQTRYCFHVTSPYIFPSGFCKKHDIPLRKTLRKGKKVRIPAPLNFLPPVSSPYDKTYATSWLIEIYPQIIQRPAHKFRTGLKLESIDECDPGFLGPVTILRIVEHMLHLHYDGWPVNVPKNSIWMSADSPDIFPVGYAELTGHKLQGPPSDSSMSKLESP